MSIIKHFQSNIMDNSCNSIKYYLTKVNKQYVLHICNPSNDKININGKNKPFFKKIIEMLFDSDYKKNKGCFNYEHPDSNDPLYDYDFNQLMNKFLVNDYCIILINDKMDPLSYLSISNNTLWTLCTNHLYRNKGNMTILINHVFKLINNNKLKTNVDLPNLTIYIKKNNPIKDKLFNYYKTFNFKMYQDISDYLILKYN